MTFFSWGGCLFLFPQPEFLAFYSPKPEAFTTYGLCCAPIRPYSPPSLALCPLSYQSDKYKAPFVLSIGQREGAQTPYFRRFA